ncbi:glycosyltransferase involved in cell wall biosynthesis [Actinomycetospora succinea]|uniref:Glycosyltransferase involved in cell wall biosynthesis n=1 Tax=Actinomycetospora succinea TaxID=663603 RepID=A0A4R6UZ09_9PSEU|nr:glycosyltransferase involved in cell wall biosynthesis [Actinomycetospora succinea]
MTVQRNGEAGEGHPRHGGPLVPPPLAAFPELALPRVGPRPAEEPRLDKVSLVIPAMNEATNIAWVLGQLPSCVDEVVLVDGHSRDATVMIAQTVRPDIHVVEQSGTGKGDALREGFLAATGDHIVMIDADGSMAPDEIPHYLHFLDNGYDFVKGSRFMGGGGSRDITRLRRSGNRVLVGMVNRMHDTVLTDLCYGYVAFHRRCLPYLDLTRPGFEVETSLTVSALRAGFRIAEVPSLEMPRRHGHSNLHVVRDGTRVLRTLLREHDRGPSGRAVQQLRRFVHHRDRPPAVTSGPTAPDPVGT